MKLHKLCAYKEGIVPCFMRMHVHNEHYEGRRKGNGRSGSRWKECAQEEPLRASYP